MRRARLPRALLAGAGILAGACSATAPAGSPAPAAPDAPPCPVEAVRVVVSVDQWSDVVTQVGGRCTAVTTIVTASSGDPHDFEPSPSDVAAIGAAGLVVVNGLGYDRWAARAAEQATPAPVLVDAGRAAGAHEGDNPHLWYSPPAIDATAAAVTAELHRLLPAAAGYLDDRTAALRRELAPYTDTVASMRQRHQGRAYAATEPVFDLMAAALGLADRTPPGYRAAATNGSDPSPADLAAFQSLLRRPSGGERAGGGADVLVHNTQTEGEATSQVRDVADAAGVPIVEVTETLPPGRPSFVDWQLDQLHRLDTALAGAR